MFASNFIMGAFSGMAGARVSMRAKLACMKAALNQDCEYYDVKSTPGENWALSSPLGYFLQLLRVALC